MMLKKSIFILFFSLGFLSLGNVGVAKRENEIKIELPEIVKQPTPEELTAIRMDVKKAVEETERICRMEKIKLLDTFINHLKSLERSGRRIHTDVVESVEDLFRIFKELRAKEKAK